MTCTTDKEPFIGFFDSTGKAINATDKYLIKKDGNNNILEILNVEESDYGEYMCKDSASEDTATVEIDGIHSVYITSISFPSKLDFLQKPFWLW